MHPYTLHSTPLFMSLNDRVFSIMWWTLHMMNGWNLEQWRNNAVVVYLFLMLTLTKFPSLYYEAKTCSWISLISYWLCQLLTSKSRFFKFLRQFLRTSSVIVREVRQKLFHLYFITQEAHVGSPSSFNKRNYDNYIVANILLFLRYQTQTFFLKTILIINLRDNFNYFQEIISLLSEF